MDTAGQAAGPWYREPWPWVVIGITGSSVILGIALVVIATLNADGLVAEDYYKRGLAINEVLVRERSAQDLGLSAQLLFGAQRVRVLLHQRAGAPQSLRLHLVHPTRARRDLEVDLPRQGPGLYEAALPEVDAVRWRVHLEDAQRSWRLAGRWDGAASAVQLDAQLP